MYLFLDPQTPVPDYEELDIQESYEKYFSFAKNFGNVINNIKLIGIDDIV
jgi:DNA polymerase II small subunit/DNA polymerase delta subunit B